MLHAYDEVFLDDAMDALGAAVEYAVLQCGMEGQQFLELFVISGVAKEFGKGNPLFVSGRSGVELAGEVLRRVGLKEHRAEELPYIDYPAEYWVGWILAYYQWYSSRSFKNILGRLSYEQISDLHGVLHEADPQKAVEIFEEIVSQNGETNLAQIRKRRGLFQSELAGLSGVSIRLIQLFEQRKSNIDNARYNNLKAIAGILRCEVEDLLEMKA